MLKGVNWGHAPFWLRRKPIMAFYRLTETGTRRPVDRRGRCSVRGQWRRRASTAVPLIPAGSAADAGYRPGTRRRRVRTRDRRPAVLAGTTAEWRRRAGNRWRCWVVYASCCRHTSAASRPLLNTTHASLLKQPSFGLITLRASPLKDLRQNIWYCCGGISCKENVF